MAYAEQVGEYLHADGSKGPRKSWYPRTSAIRTERTLAPVSTHQPTHHTVHLDAQVGKRHGIGAGCRLHDDVQSTVGRQDVLADDLAQPAFEPIAIHR